MRKVLKWTLRIGGSLIGLIGLMLGVVYAWSGIRMNKTYPLKSDRIMLQHDSITLGRGKHLATAITKCVDCHGENFGGKIMIDDPALGRLVAPNLTRGKGSITEQFTDEDWVRAIRYGIRPDGKGMLFMPANEYWHNDDDELGAIISYIKSVPPVDNVLPPSSAGPLIRLMYVIGQVNMVPTELIDLSAPRPATPAPGPTVEYGKHLTTTGGCIGCHGPTLSGGKIPGAPPEWPEAQNLTPHATGLASWTQEDFFRALRTGVRPDGTKINPFMPWKATAKMTDEEITALWLYIHQVEPKESGNR